MAMADAAFGRRFAFAFLDEVKTRFTTAYGEAAATALAHSYNEEFSRVLSQQMQYFSSNPSSDLLSRAKSDLSEVKSVLVDSIDLVVERGEKIELLRDRTAGLSADATSFRKQSSNVKSAMWLKNVQNTAVLASVVLFALYLLFATMCGVKLRGCT